MMLAQQESQCDLRAQWRGLWKSPYSLSSSPLLCMLISDKCPSYIGFFATVFFQNESTFIFSQQHQNLTWSLISPLNLIWWERRLEIAFEACGHPHPGSAHHKIVASCKFWSPSSFTCWQVTRAHIWPIWAHLGYFVANLCTFWCRCTFTDLNIMRWCTTLTNMRYATII